MLKSKLTGIACVLLLLTLIFTGCPNSDDGGNTGGNTVHVTGVTMTSDGSSNGTSIIYFGSTSASMPTSVTFTATVLPANATNKAVTWTVDPPDYVTWNESTLTATAKAVGGPTTITVKTADGGFEKKWPTIEVVDPSTYVEVTGVTIDQTGPLAFNKPEGGDFEPASATLTATVTPPNATLKDVKWSTSNPLAADVDPDTGVVTPLGNENATVSIYATSVDNESISDEIIVNITVAGAATYAVESVSITHLGEPVTTLSFNKPLNGAFTPANAELREVITPSNATNPTVSWESDNESVATVSVEGVVSPISAGTAKIRATSNDDGTKYAEVEVTVTVEGTPVEPPVDPEPGLALYNQGTPAEGTTLTIPDLDANNRYIISNKNTNASFGAGTYANNNTTGAVANSTLVYFDTPVTNAIITARIRVIDRVANNGTTGFLMGVFRRPEDPVFGALRITNNATKAIYTSRDTNNHTSNAITITPTPEYDEEFFYSYNATTGTGTVYDNSNITQSLGNATRVVGWPSAVTGDTYAGFIISGATVEISQITITSGGSTVFTSPASTPAPTPVASVEFTAPEGIANGEYSHSTAGGNNTLVIGAKVLPAKAPQDISWELVSGPATLSASTGSNVTATFTGTGTVVVKATAEDKSAQLTINVTAGAIPVSNITISAAGGKTSIMAGSTGASLAAETLQFTETVLPETATNKSVTWSVWDDDSGSLGTTQTQTAATIDSDGLLTAGDDIGANTDVWVVATANDGSNETSNAVKITIQKFALGVTISAAGGKDSIMAGNGTVAPETLQFSAAITPTSAESLPVTWSVSDTSTYSAATSATSGSIDSSGKLTAATNNTTSDGEVWVFASVASTPSTGVKITVKKYDPPIYIWALGDGGTFTLTSASPSKKVNNVTWTRNSSDISVNATTGVTITGNRFAIGTASTTNTSSSVMPSDGELNLSKAATLTITYSSYAGSGNFQVFVNNNTTSNSNSVLGNSSRIYSSSSLTAGGGTISITINPSTFSNHASLANAFLYFRTESSTTVVITGIELKYN